MISFFDKYVSMQLNISYAFYSLDRHRNPESFEYSTSFIPYHLSSTCNESALSKKLSILSLFDLLVISKAHSFSHLHSLYRVFTIDENKNR